MEAKLTLTLATTSDFSTWRSIGITTSRLERSTRMLSAAKDGEITSAKPFRVSGPLDLASNNNRQKMYGHERGIKSLYNCNDVVFDLENLSERVVKLLIFFFCLLDFWCVWYELCFVCFLLVLFSLLKQTSIDNGFCYFVNFHSVVPHITDAIQEWVERVAKVPVDGASSEPDVCIIEVSGIRFTFWWT